MDLLTIDQQTCNQDGLCAAVCPGDLIHFEQGAFPKTIPEAEENCITCGHCVAICPTGSLSHRDIPVDKCISLAKELKITPQQCDQFLKSRRSIRNFKSKAVPRKNIEELLDITRFAPTGHNSQGVRWLVLSGEDELRQLSSIVAEWMEFMLEKMPEFALSISLDRTVERWQQGVDVILRGAPALIVAYGEKENRMMATSCTIALSYLELGATGMGLGACWAGYFNAAATTFPKMKEALVLPDGCQSFGAMMLGYPKYQYSRLPERQVQDVTWRE